MQTCRTIKTNRVLALDEVTHTETLGPTDLGRAFSEESQLEGQVRVVIEECDPQFDIDKDVVEIRVEAMIQKELEVVQPGANGRAATPFEFAFRRTFISPLTAIAPSEIEALGIRLERVKCQVMDVDVEDSVTFDPGAEGRNASFTQSLTIEIDLTLDVLEIMEVVICEEEPEE